MIKFDVINEHDKDEDREESNKLSLDDVYKDENKENVELHVKGVQNLSLYTYKLVDDFQHQNLTQTLCDVSPRNFWDYGWLLISR